MHLKVDQALKQDAFGKAAKHTHAGQAYFAGTGPEGKTCRECNLWLFNGHRKTDKEPKQSACIKGTGVKFPHNALACKYFEANPKPPLAKLKEVPQ